MTINNSDSSSSVEKDLSLGEFFKRRRVDLKITITEVGNYLKIKFSDIELIENDEWDKINKRVYVAGLVKSYAKFLKIDDKEIEEKIENLSIKYNFKNSKHKLINLDKKNKLSPTKDSFFNFLLISVLLFFALLLLYNSFDNRDSLITNRNLVKELGVINKYD